MHKHVQSMVQDHILNPRVQGSGCAQVLEVNALGSVQKQEVSRRQLLKSSGEGQTNHPHLTRVNCRGSSAPHRNRSQGQDRQDVTGGSRGLAGLRQRDVRRVDPSLWVTNSMPALLVGG